MGQNSESANAAKAPSPPAKPERLRTHSSSTMGKELAETSPTIELAISAPTPPNKPNHFRPSMDKTNAATGQAVCKVASSGGYTYRSPSFRKLNRSEASIGLSLFAHNLGYASALTLVCFGIFGIIWNSEFVRIDEAVRPKAKEYLWGYIFVGPLCIVEGILLFAFEYKFGLCNSKLLGEVSGRSYFRPSVYLLSSVCAFLSFATMFAGVVLIICFAINLLACLRKENLGEKGVPGASYLLCNFQKKLEHGEEPSKSKRGVVLAWLKRQREIGNIQQIVLVSIYVAVNVVLWVDAAVRWSKAVAETQEAPECLISAHLCLSGYAPYAKAFGQTLNFNCSFLLLPILRALLRKLNNLESQVKWSTLLLPPLRKNLTFHKFIALFVLGGAVGHIFFHYLNFAVSPEATLARFTTIPLLSGAGITLAMVIIFAGAQNRVKRANYEVFWKSHHSFVVFFGLLLAHGPKFWAWSLIPVVGYVAEQIFRHSRSRTVFYVASAKYSKPVLKLSFFPRNLKEFKFKEGQYLYVCCPMLSKNEWHPFTISSAFEDLEKKNGVVTLHIRVQGPGSWTYCLRDLFKEMVPLAIRNTDRFSCPLTHIDENGIVQIGKHLGPDGNPLLLIDGPHSAPAQHYTEYSEVVLVGAGIGLTPSAAIIQAVLRHKWRKGFSPKTIHFYWVVRHSEASSFDWFTQLLVKLEMLVQSNINAGNLDPEKNRLFVHIFVTRAPKDIDASTLKLKRQSSVRFTGLAKEVLNKGYIQEIGLTNENPIKLVGFNEMMLKESILCPTVPANQYKEFIPCDASQVTSCRHQARPNQFLDIYVWNGRPDWDSIFLQVKSMRQPTTSQIGVCFCGTPIIGKDLKKYCHKYSSLDEGCRFVLHKENF